MINSNKKTAVGALVLDIEKNNDFALVKIDKTSHQNLEKLRRDLRKVGGSVKVVKNNFFEKAINKLTQKNKTYLELKKKFFPIHETSAMITFGDDWGKGLKAFSEFAKTEKTLSFKLSLLDNHIYDSVETTKISGLPSKDQLIGKIIGSMKSPMSKFVYSLKYNTNKFVYVLQAKSKEVKS